MPKPTYQIMLCQSFRAKGDPKGVCHKQTEGFMQYMEEEILDRGLDVLLTATGCLKACEEGPVMVIQPNNWWYKGVNSESVIDEIFDALEDGEPCEEHLLYPA